jgi:hypothetical protein
MQTEDAARGPTATTPPEPPRQLFAGLHIDQQTAVITGRHGQDEHALSTDQALFITSFHDS